MHAFNLLDFSRAAVVVVLLLSLIVRNTQCTNNRTSGRSQIRIKLHQKPRTLELANQLRACNLIDLDNAETQNLTQTLYKLMNNEGTAGDHPNKRKLRACHKALRSAAFMPYISQIQIGDPPQLFEVMFDTGSDVLWVPHTQCQLNGATWDSGPRARFASDQSRSYKRQTRERLTLKYGNGMHFKGWWVTETIGLEDVCDNSRSLTVHDQTLGLICQIEGPTDSHNPEFDAMVGLSFPSHSSAGHTTFLENLFSSNKPLLDRQVFSFHVNQPATKVAAQQQTGELIFGYIDRSLFTGEVMWAPVVRTPLWDIRIHSVRLLDAHEPRMGPDSPQASICAYGCLATVDTGTSTIVGPEADVAELNRQLGFVRSRHMPDIYYAPGACDRYRQGAKSLVFGIANTWHLELGPETYMIDTDLESGGSVCISALRSLEAEPNDWILGSPFMSNFYTIFDYGRKRVGFAQPTRSVS